MYVHRCNIKGYSMYVSSYCSYIKNVTCQITPRKKAMYNVSDNTTRKLCYIIPQKKHTKFLLCRLVSYVDVHSYVTTWKKNSVLFRWYLRILSFGCVTLNTVWSNLHHSICTILHMSFFFRHYNITVWKSWPSQLFLSINSVTDVFCPIIYFHKP
jgi:hypothetical protein